MVQEPVHLEQSAERSGLAAGGTCPPFKAVNSHFRQKAAFLTQDSFFFFLFKIYLFIFGSARSSLLCTGFLQLRRAGVTLQLWHAGFSL